MLAGCYGRKVTESSYECITKKIYHILLGLGRYTILSCTGNVLQRNIKYCIKIWNISLESNNLYKSTGIIFIPNFTKILQLVQDLKVEFTSPYVLDIFHTHTHTHTHTSRWLHMHTKKYKVIKFFGMFGSYWKLVGSSQISYFFLYQALRLLPTCLR
jgi:hypothetical protein